MKLETTINFFIPILVFLATSFVITNVALADTYNLAPNPSFEGGTTEPEGWAKTNTTSCNESTQVSHPKQVWDSSKSLTGTKSLSLQNINWTNNSGYIPGSWITKDYIDLDMSKGSLYIINRSTGSSSNINLSDVIWVCIYDKDNNLISSTSIKGSPPREENEWGWPGGNQLQVFPDNSKSMSKMKIGLSASCNESRPCSGSIWFDDIDVRYRGKLGVNAFNDKNENGTKEFDEEFLIFKINIYEGFGCIGQTPAIEASTTPYSNGDYGLPEGEYSIKELLQPGWINLSPQCQNTVVRGNEITIVKFANAISPSLPYLSQKDHLWASQEYDHANTIGPFFCGTTIGGCGCAITSSAMLLKYHGATKSPTGEETNPSTLNNWLKANNGYAFGALKWNSVAAYSVKANQNFGTQKIRFVGTGPPNNYSLLDSDLTNNNPVILQEPGHFIVAKGKQAPTYAINDPAFTSKTTLESYSNSFLSSRRFEKTSTDLSAIYISTPSPNELFIVDPQGRRAGKDPQTGQTYSEIPNSFYFLEPSFSDQTQENATPPADLGVNMLVIINPGKGSFDFSAGQGQINISFYNQNGDITQKEFTADTSKSLNVSYSPIPGETSSFLQKIQIDVIPTSTQNRIYPKSGNVEVLVKKTAQFNPALFDIPSAVLGNAQVHPYKSKNSKKGLSLYFKVRDLNLNESDRILCLTGQDTSGIPLKGCDFIKVHR